MILSPVSQTTRQNTWATGYHTGWYPANGSKSRCYQNMAKPKNRKALQSFIGLINYYCNMWRHQSEQVAPLIELLSNKKPFNGRKNINKIFTRLEKSSPIKRCCHIPTLKILLIYILMLATSNQAQSSSKTKSLQPSIIEN